MLYSEFLVGTGAVDCKESYTEYKRVEQIYMESDHCTKEDAYRMARVVTVKEHEKMMKLERKEEEAWVRDNIISAAAFIRAIAELNGSYGPDYFYFSPCGNQYQLKLFREINGGSVMLYEMFVNSQQIDTSELGFKYLARAEFPSYRAGWHRKSRKELEDLFGYIA